MKKHTIFISIVAITVPAAIAFAVINRADKVTDVQVNFATEDVSTTTISRATPSTNQTESSLPVVKKAEILDLSGQGLTKAPAHIFERIGVKELNLRNNQIEGSLQGEVRHLKELRTLDLSNNKFTGVPAEIGQLEKLEVLNLSNNRLTGLPMELGNLKNLILLDLRGNAYSEQDLANIKMNIPSTAKILVD